MIDIKFFDSALYFRNARFKCYLTGDDGRINASDDPLILTDKSVRSTKLRVISRKFQECLSTANSFEGKNATQLIMLRANLTRVNEKIQNWNINVGSNYLLRLINMIFSITINPLHLNELNGIISIRSEEEALLRAREDNINVYAQYKKEYAEKHPGKSTDFIDADLSNYLKNHANRDHRTLKVVINHDKDGPTLEVFDKEVEEKFIHENCELEIGDIRTAKYIFLGDCHIDPTHAYVRSRIFNYLQTFYPLDAQQDMLVEAEQYGSRINLKGAPRTAACIPELSLTAGLIASGKIHCNGWENMELYHEDGLCFSEIEDIPKKLNGIRDELASLHIESDKNRLNPDIAERRVCMKLLHEKKMALYDSTSTLNARLERMRNRQDELMDLRNKAMIASVKKTGEVAARVFCIAGSLHLRDPKAGYDVSSFFDRDECAVIIPKKSFTPTSADNEKYRQLLVAQARRKAAVL